MDRDMTMAEAEGPKAQADERGPANTPHGMVTPHGGQLGAAEAPWGSSQCLSGPQPGAGGVNPGHWGQGQDRMSDVWAESTGEPGVPAQGLTALRAKRESWAMAVARGVCRAGQAQGHSSVPSALTVFQRETVTLIF